MVLAAPPIAAITIRRLTSMRPEPRRMHFIYPTPSNRRWPYRGERLYAQHTARGAGRVARAGCVVARTQRLGHEHASFRLAVAPWHAFTLPTQSDRGLAPSRSAGERTICDA